MGVALTKSGIYSSFQLFRKHIDKLGETQSFIRYFKGFYFSKIKKTLFLMHLSCNMHKKRGYVPGNC